MTQIDVTQGRKGTNIRLGLAFLAGLALFALYLYFMSFFSGPIVFGSMDAVESAIFYTMILRIVAFLIAPPLRRVNPQVKIIVLSFEAFILFSIMIVVLFTASSAYTQLMAEVLTAWVACVLIIVTPYSIYEFSHMMYKGTSITSLAFSSAPLVAICLFLANLPARVPNAPSGIGNFGVVVIGSFKAEPGFAGGGPTGETYFISGASVLFFLSIIIYIIFHLNQSTTDFSRVPKYHYALGLIVIGGFVTCLWLLVSYSFLNGNVFEILSVPAAAIPIILWVVSRER